MFSKPFTFVAILIFVQLISSQFPRSFDSANRRERPDILGDLDKFKEQQRKFLEENARFNASGFFRSPPGGSDFAAALNQSDIQERLQKLKNTIPNTLGIKCYDSRDACLNEGNCRSESNCIPCMNWDTRKAGFRCLKQKDAYIGFKNFTEPEDADDADDDDNREP